jgi:hypothetical protein
MKQGGDTNTIQVVNDVRDSDGEPVRSSESSS